MYQTKREIGTLRKGEIIGGLLYLPMFFLGSQILAALIVRALGLDPTQDSSIGPLNLVYDLLNVAILALIFRHYLSDQFRRLLARGWALFADLLMGFLVQFGLSYLAALVVSMLSMRLGIDYSNANQQAVETAAFLSPLATILCACVLAPIAEELLFRGLIFCGLRRRSRFWAYAVSMLVFSLAHVLGFLFSQSPGLSLMNLVVYLPYGFALAWIYERSGSIWSSVFLHAMINVFSMLLQSLIR